MVDPAEKITAYLSESAAVTRQAAQACASQIATAAEAIITCFGSGGKILLCGNGGSAADCQHIAAEFVGLLDSNVRRPGVPAIALTTDTSVITGYANDIGFEMVFARQVQALGKAGDVLIAISTSGGSLNVLNAVDAARAIDVRTIALTGSSGNLAEKTDVNITIPSNSTQHIQESMLAIEHILCELVEFSLFGSFTNNKAESV